MNPIEKTIFKRLTKDMIDALVIEMQIAHNEINIDGNGIFFCAKTVKDRLIDGLKSKYFYSLIALEQGNIIGFAVFTVINCYSDISKLQCVEIAWHSKPGLSNRKRFALQDKLMAYVEVWANDRGCDSIQTGTIPGTAMDKILLRRKYKFTGQLMVKEIYKEGT